MKLTHYSDSAHGWVKVKGSLLVKLGIENKISSFSYAFGGDVFLEEDSDFSIFYDACAAQNIKIELNQSYCDGQSSIRGYSSYVNSPAVLQGLKTGDEFKMDGVPYVVVGEKGRSYLVKLNKNGLATGSIYRVSKKYVGYFS
jgi:hypothetical protein